MSHAFAIFPTPLATWSRRVALFSLQIALFGIVLHRLLTLPTPVALNLFGAAFAGAVLAVLLGIAAFVSIWRQGRSGAWSAAGGLFFGLALLAWPASVTPLLYSLPPINDVTTDPGSPPRFAALAKERPAGANPIAYRGNAVAQMQIAAYPDVRPVVIPRPVNEMFELVTETARRLRWKIIADQAPQGRGKPGLIEAVDRTLIIGFYDDIVVRIEGDQRETRVDIRSASRYGQHDFGRNANRVRKFYKELEARLEASVTGSDRPRRRRAAPDAAVPKRQKGAPVASAAQPKGQARAQPGSRREPPPKEKQRPKASDPARDKR